MCTAQSNRGMNEERSNSRTDSSSLAFRKDFWVKWQNSTAEYEEDQSTLACGTTIKSYQKSTVR